MNELNKLDLIAKDSWYAKGVSSVMVRYSFEIFARFLSGSSILEMGPAEGLMTEHLSKLGKRLVVVEGAQTFCENLRIRYPEIEVVHSLFENFDTNEKFDNIILGHVLEHVESPADILSLKCRKTTSVSLAV